MLMPIFFLGRTGPPMASGRCGPGLDGDVCVTPAAAVPKLQTQFALTRAAAELEDRWGDSKTSPNWWVVGRGGAPHSARCSRGGSTHLQEGRRQARPPCFTTEPGEELGGRAWWGTLGYSAHHPYFRNRDPTRSWLPSLARRGGAWAAQAVAHKEPGQRGEQLSLRKLQRQTPEDNCRG